ncbi:2-succinyl-5-enolpyruvyl-6-hydroxy-3-cyclohexene-1-carboxylic-acid synthase [uncultured Corynebacterium sp.]|uniref:2-succinyl-5-enolpyruvyl-6-hydroxy-3- cyclohexene-1-carboxylic-acid synthase n=1 Tax=uncultured Corynebacterium sp. TaxID=159447 RepID=UPI0025F49D09|nr:2-succinyl-5-enolpyruvyl-6-hydroxy-3-cyclohexene-1-carboxylic-acid synthase [uncultured Corynebacterium sp.]
MSSSGVAPASIMTAVIIVDELIRCGVQDVVVCPGSRSAPLALAFSEAAARGEITLHMRTDERTAAFLALGLAQAAGGPRRNRPGIPGGHHVVPMVMTSGSAVAHCAPAMVEAQMSHLPLMVLSANRPWSLWGTGANQTVDQRSAFRDTAVRMEGIDTATRRSDAWHVMHREVRTAVDRAVVAATATGVRMQVQAAAPEDAHSANAVELPFRGPVHIDVPFDNPLVPTDDDQLHEAAQSANRLGRPDGGSWTRFVGRAKVSSPRVLHIAGHNAPHVEALRGVPTIAEPTAAVPDVPIHPLALSLLSPDHVVVTGRPTLHRDVSKLLARPDIPITVIADNPGDYPDVAHMAGEVATSIGLPPQSRPWVDHCRSVDQAAADAVREVILLDDLTVPPQVTGPVKDFSAEPATTEPAATKQASPLHRMTGLTVAAAVADSVHVGDALVVGASNPVRDLSFVGAPFDGIEMYSNRGASGIDGFLSTAIGVALSRQATQPDTVSAPRTVALAGDLTFLHDATGLNVVASEPRPSNLLIVVANDQGGGIFEALEPGKPELRSHFERVMATYHEVNIKSICDAFGMTYRRADTAEELVTLLESHAEGMPLNDGGATRSSSGDQRDQADDRREPYEGITVIEAVCDRAHRRQTVESMEGRVAVLHRRQAQ